jgi:hypothetical protein
MREKGGGEIRGVVYNTKVEDIDPNFLAPFYSGPPKLRRHRWGEEELEKKYIKYHEEIYIAGSHGGEIHYNLVIISERQIQTQ